jgi:branched-chain amino acid transport system permease protein
MSEPARGRRLAADLLSGRRRLIAIPLLLACALLLFPWWSGHNLYWIRELTLIATLSLVISGVNLSFGYAGEVQFGQVFMFALGGYVASIIAVHGYAEIVPLLLLGAAVAGVVGLVVAVPAVRVGGWALAMASFFLVLIIPDVAAIFTKYTGGALGLVGIPSPTWFGSAMDSQQVFIVSAVCLIIWIALFRNLVTSRYGVIFRILRESQVLATSNGFSVFRLKALAYSLGALPAGAAGVLYGFINGVLSPDSFGLQLGIGIVAASVLGGVEAVYCVVIGAAILQLGPEQSLDFSKYATIIYGGFLIVAALLLRQGISGIAGGLGRRVARFIDGTGPRGRRLGDTVLRAAVREDHPTALPKLEPSKGARLSISALSKSFGGVRAVREVTLAAEPAAITALIGSNGSGKTTLLNVVCGFEAPTSGSVKLDGLELTGITPHRIARMGVGRVFQTPIIPRGVTVLDVVASGRYSTDPTSIVSSVLRLPKYWRARRADRREAMFMLELVDLGHRAADEAQSLSLGMRRLVELARALCGKPRLLLLDEPASGLSDVEAARLREVLAIVAEAGTTVILIEHNFPFVRQVAGMVHVLHLGELIASGTADRVGSDEKVIESYLGTSSASRATAPPVVVVSDVAERELVAKPVLELKSAVTGYRDLEVLHGLSLSLTEGQVEVLLGRNSVGKSTTMKAITGQLRLWHGQVVLDGRDVSRHSVHYRANAGVSLVQEGKRIFRNRTVHENLMLGCRHHHTTRNERQEICDEMLTRFPILGSRARQVAGGLSGGQQQILAIAQALAARPRILLLDEPSAGLAPSLIDEVFDHISQLRRDGMTILLVEQLAEKALTVGDHVTVMDDGVIVASGPPSMFQDMSELQRAYLGGNSTGLVGRKELDDGPLNRDADRR